MLQCLNYFKRKFVKIDKAHKPSLFLSLSLSRTITHIPAHRGWPSACGLLCTAHLGISLMQGDAIQEQSDAKPAVWGVIVPSCHVLLSLYFLSHFVRPCAVALRPSASADVCFCLSRGVHFHDREDTSGVVGGRGYLCNTASKPSVFGRVSWRRSRVRGPSTRCRSSSSARLVISMTEELSCQSS